MNLFLSGTSFLPSYGGPARSVSRLASALVDAGMNVSIWAPDGSAVNSPFLTARPSLRLLSGPLQGALSSSSPTIIHDNGIWLPHNHQIASACRKLKIPRVVSIRGMLHRAAFRHKSVKKKIAWLLYQKADLRTASALHLTSEEEAAEVSAYRLGVPVSNIPVGVDLPLSLPPRETGAGRIRTAIFVGRLHPIKGLPLLIEAWHQVQPTGWRMLIVGPEEENHRKELERLVSLHRLQTSFTFAGALEGVEKSGALRSSELFILPSFSENFGVAIGEALAHELPVITTTGTPWKGLVTNRCGWHVPATVNGLAEALQEATSLNRETLEDMGKKGRIFVAEQFSWPSVARQTIDLYQSSILRQGH